MDVSVRSPQIRYFLVISPRIYICKRHILYFNPKKSPVISFKGLNTRVLPGCRFIHSVLRSKMSNGCFCDISTSYIKPQGTIYHCHYLSLSLKVLYIAVISKIEIVLLGLNMVMFDESVYSYEVFEYLKAIN